MQRLSRSFLRAALLACVALGAASLSAAAAPGQPVPEPLAAVAGSVFDVRLSVPALEGPTPDHDECGSNDPLRTLLGPNAQFAFSAGAQPTLTIAFTNRSDPIALAASDPVAVTAAGDVVTAPPIWLGFDHLSVGFEDLRIVPNSAETGRVIHVAGRVQASVRLMEVGLVCSRFDFHGDGGLDTTPPAAVGIAGCKVMGDACFVLADAPVALAFSERVDPASVPPALSLTTEDGQPIRIFSAQPNGAGTIALRGNWPFERRVLLMVGAGVRDLAGNRSAVARVFLLQVVDDPGLLDNPGFEYGDFTNYAVTASYGDPVQWTAATDTLLGLVPDEGSLMAAIGSLEGCSPWITLTSRSVVPDGASSLVVEFDLIDKVTGTLLQPDNVLRGSVRSAAGIMEVALARPEGFARQQALSDPWFHTGWQPFAVPVDGLAGQEIVFTLEVHPNAPVAVLGSRDRFFCTRGVVLLDDIHFE